MKHKKKNNVSSAYFQTTIPTFVVREWNFSLSSTLSSAKKLLSKIQFPAALGNQFNKKNIGKRVVPFALLAIIIGAIVLVSGRVLSYAAKPQQQEDRLTLKGPKATLSVNKEFSFPILDGKGNELTRLKYTIENAELRDEIVVKGTRATSLKGRIFLILTIKIVNELDRALSVNARDYVRLVVNAQESEMMAADIHNDPVSVQAISTKTTRLGFPINEADTNLVLKIGEIKGGKESLPLQF